MIGWEFANHSNAPATSGAKMAAQAGIEPATK